MVINGNIFKDLCEEAWIPKPPFVYLPSKLKNKGYEKNVKIYQQQFNRVYCN